MGPISPARFVLYVLVLASPGMASIVSNGSFGTGDFTDWTVTGFDAPCSPNDVYCGVFDESELPFPIPSGDAYAAYFGPVDAETYLTQDLSSLAPSTSYTLTLSLDEEISPSLPTYTNFFGIYFDGTGNGNGTPVFSESNVADSGGAYSTLSFTLTTAASGNSDQLQFAFMNDIGYFLVDNISVVQAAPEPTSFALFLIGLAVCGAGRLAWRLRESLSR